MSSYILKLEIDITVMLPELLRNCWVMNMLPFLPCHRSVKSTHFKQAEPQWQEAVFRPIPKLRIFPAEPQNTKAPPTLKWPLALKI